MIKIGYNENLVNNLMSEGIISGDISLAGQLISEAKKKILMKN